MNDKKFDQHLNELLNGHEVPFEPEHWKLMDEHLDAFGLEEIEILDAEQISELQGFEVAAGSPDWEVMSNMLDEIDQNSADEFDHEIKENVGRYEAPYDPATWPILETKLSLAQRRRQRLVVAKSLELLVVMLLLLSLYNFYPELKSHLSQPDQPKQELTHPAPIASLIDLEVDEQDLAKVDHNLVDSESQLTSQIVRSSTNLTQPEQSIQGISHQSIQPSTIATETSLNNLVLPTEARESQLENDFIGNKKASTELSGEINQSNQITISQLNIDRDLPIQKLTPQMEGFVPDAVDTEVSEVLQLRPLMASVQPIQSLLGILHVPLYDDRTSQMLYGGFKAKLNRPALTRFGIHTGASVNILHFPADRFYTSGNEIEFAAQDLPALGYSGGFSVGWYGKRFGFETGLRYSSKSFKPGRQLLVGESLNNSKIDFQAVQIDLITVPASLSYQVKNAGKTRVYVVSGFDFNVIARANYDLKIQNNYPAPLSIAQSAAATATNREAHRIREHILDGATFNSKTFITAHAGFGVERYLNPDLSIFMQPTYYYQIPFNGFSNNNGKNIKSLNLQIGTRLPLK